MFAGLKRHFLTGLLAITPLAVTSWILWRFYGLLSRYTQPWLRRIPTLGEALPEFVLTLLGAAAFVIAIALVGLFTRNLIGVAFFSLVDRFFQRIPVVKRIFTALKQISSVFQQEQRTAFQQVVMFAYPRPGLFALGFVTRDALAGELVSVFLPTTPNPTSGFLLLVPSDEITRLAIPVEDAIKLIVSGGSIMTPEQATLIERQVRPGPAAGTDGDDEKGGS